MTNNDYVVLNEKLQKMAKGIIIYTNGRQVAIEFDDLAKIILEKIDRTVEENNKINENIKLLFENQKALTKAIELLSIKEED